MPLVPTQINLIWCNDMTLFFVQKILNVFLEWSMDSSKTKQNQNIKSSVTPGSLNN